MTLLTTNYRELEAAIAKALDGKVHCQSSLSVCRLTADSYVFFTSVVLLLLSRICMCTYYSSRCLKTSRALYCQVNCFYIFQREEIFGAECRAVHRSLVFFFFFFEKSRLVVVGGHRRVIFG